VTFAMFRLFNNCLSTLARYTKGARILLLGNGRADVVNDYLAQSGGVLAGILRSGLKRAPSQR
jgi:hypothetical protein